MPKVTLASLECASEDPSDNGQAQLTRLQVLGRQITELRTEPSVYRTAWATDAQALTSELGKSAPEGYARAWALQRMADRG